MAKKTKKVKEETKALAKPKVRRRSKNPGLPSVVNAGSFKNPSTQMFSVAGVDFKELALTVSLPVGVFTGATITTKLVTSLVNKKLAQLSFIQKHVGPGFSTALLLGGWFATKTRYLSKYRTEILTGLFFAWGVEFLKTYLPVVSDWLLGKPKPQVIAAPVVQGPQTNLQSVTVAMDQDFEDTAMVSDSDTIPDEDLTFDVLTRSN